MRGATHARWAACAAAVALAATACGGGGGDGGSGGGSGGVLSSSWGDPQNPLEPANTNEVQGGKVLDMIFRGLKKYDPGTGEAQNMLAEKIDTSDSQNFTVTVKDGWTFSNGEKVTAQSFVDAWNYGASLKNNQRNAYFFAYIDGYDKVHPESGSQSTDTLSGLKVTGPRTFTIKLSQKFSTFPDTLGYPAFAPLPKAFFDDHDAWLKKPVGNGPYQVDNYTRGSQMSLRKWDDYPGPDKAQNGGVDLKVYTDNNTAYTDLIAGNLDLVDDVPASQLKNVKNDLGDRYINTPAGIIQTLAFPFYDNDWNKSGSEKVRKGLSMAIDRKQITDTIFQNTAPRPPTGPHRSSARTAATSRACAGTPASTTPRRPRSWSRRAADSPAGRSRSPTTPTPAPTSSGSTRSATPSTTPWTTTAPAPGTRSAPSPTSATRSPTRR